MLKDASYIHFDLFHEILNVSLHGVLVSFNEVQYNTMSSTPIFEASSMFEFGFAVTSYDLRGMPPECCQVVQVLSRVLTRASIDDSTKARTNVKHDKVNRIHSSF